MNNLKFALRQLRKAPAFTVTALATVAICLGANLAKREITVMFREIFRRLPDLEITGPPERLFSPFIHGIKHMPCEFVAAKPAA